MVDLRKCKPGDKLVSKHGMVLTYRKHFPSSEYPHKVIYPDGSSGSRLDDGRVYRNCPRPEDHDIMAIITEKDFKVKRKTIALAQFKRAISVLSNQMENGCGSTDCIIKAGDRFAPCLCHPGDVQRTLELLVDKLAGLGDTWQ